MASGFSAHVTWDAVARRPQPLTHTHKRLPACHALLPRLSRPRTGASAARGLLDSRAQQPMAGNLKRHAGWWEKRAGSNVWSWIQHGLQLVWQRAPDGSRPPPPLWLSRNHAGASQHAAHLDSDIALLASGAVATCRPKFSTVVSPLNVVPKPGSTKLRTIINMRHVNANAECPKFQHEELSSLTPLAQHNDWLFSLDLASGFHQIDMQRSAWPFLGFAWRGRHYYFKVLPFGLTSAPWCFTKVMRWWCRKSGVQACQSDPIWMTLPSP